MNFVSKTLTKAKKETKSVLRRSTDKHVRVAVTGLSGSGKTAFITGLVHQLLKAGITDQASSLPLWHVNREQRLYGVERELQPDLAISSFDYQGAINSLTDSPAKWPTSTRNISELRLAIHYQPESGVLSKFTDRSTVILDIIDYPGEWLLDLPLLDLSYTEWCQQQGDKKVLMQSSPYYKAFYQSLLQLDLQKKAETVEIEHVAKLYQTLLQDLFNERGYYLAQPGRMLLPGDLTGSPMVTWFPLLHLSPDELAKFDKESSKDSLYQVIQNRYQGYVEQVVTPFYRNHFCHFDRQVVLVDSLTALNQGQQQFNDMLQALSQIIQSFQFGKSNFLRRLFSPKIDKLLFAATKVDHITRNQQSNLLQLLNDMLRETRQKVSLKGCDVETMAISAIKATKHGMVESNGKKIEVVKGRKLGSYEQVTLFPGDVPKRLPKPDFWQQQGFQFLSFAPPKALEGEVQPELEHIRLDHLLQYLLGDKLE
ncbi:YcjX family protein [Parashewanella spongiae]|uniref:YcjX family protein n=1 Tax=Parashewanella spongiae TaxID=342950 RepID=A0A3A6TSV3_9GAMM|nr:YcjX family protein [Parashewanella spongiae]MCL1079359.1 YcjX family protein [Parashewanella spongiae]RJY11126.1 YcjX family protein [Parashewanella spongiae]